MQGSSRCKDTAAPFATCSCPSVYPLLTRSMVSARYAEATPSVSRAARENAIARRASDWKPMDSPSLLDLFFLPEYLRGTLAGALTRSELMSYGAADVVSSVILALIMAIIYFGIAGALMWSFRSRAQIDEAIDRAAAGTRRTVSPDAPWRELVPRGIEPDACAWVVNDQGTSRVFTATVLRLLRTGVMEIRDASLEDGLMEFVLRGRPESVDELGCRAVDMIFPDGCRRVCLSAVMDDDDWTTAVLGDQISGFTDTAKASCAESGLIEPVGDHDKESFDILSVVLVLAGLIGAIWFSSALPSPVTIGIFIAASIVFSMSLSFIRTRALTPAGVLAVERLEALATRLRAAAESGARIGDAEISAAVLIEYAVVIGLRAKELARLADASGSAALRRLLSEPLLECEACPSDISSKEVVSYRRRFRVTDSKSTRLAMIERIFGYRVDWYRSELSD